MTEQQADSLIDRYAVACVELGEAKAINLASALRKAHDARSVLRKALLLGRTGTQGETT